MTRMIERWFPCEEVSQNTQKGWGTGNTQKALFTWFAARPAAQAKAAVLCSLLPWPEDPAEQKRLQNLVRQAMNGRDSYDDEIAAEITKAHPGGASMLDPYSGRAMIPYEAARLGVETWGIDYSPVATLAGRLLATYPLQDWSQEPPLPFEGYDVDGTAGWGRPRLLADVEFVLKCIEDRFDCQMAGFYPVVDGVQPWGYLWAVSLPCVNCGNRFPLTGNLVLRPEAPQKNDPGQSYRIHADRESRLFEVEVHSGPPTEQPTLVSVKGRRGKSAVCPFCDHAHQTDVHSRLMNDQQMQDELLAVADLDDEFSKNFRSPTETDRAGIEAASEALATEKDFGPGLRAVPDERVPPGNNHTIRPSKYGYGTYGSFANDRQTLGFVRLCRIINDVYREASAAVSRDYAEALAGYAASGFVRKMRRSTRGARLQIYKDGRPSGVEHIFVNEASINFSYDYFEAGVGTSAAGTWGSICGRTVSALGDVLETAGEMATPVRCERGSAASLPMRDGTLTAVVTDPPYDSMIDYTDASDLFFVWLKRALVESHPELGLTAHPLGLQEKDEEAIVKDSWKSVGDHRDEDHYDRCITAAFSQARAKVEKDGVVTIVFGHGDPEVWHRLLGSITSASLILTGSWPARTEKGGKSGSANIETTLTLACRPAPANRAPGRVAEVDEEVRSEMHARIPLWEAAGLALSDQLMASAGPAMEVVGRYSEVLDKRGEPVALDRYLPLARRFVEEAADIRVDSLPLGTFDDKTRFGIFWARANGRNVMPGSEARWQRLAADLADDETEGILTKVSKGVRLAFGREHDAQVEPTSSVIDVALALAANGKSLADAATVLVASDRTSDDFLWACVHELSRAVPEADEDGEVWTWLVRNRQQVVSATRNVEATRAREAAETDTSLFDRTLFDTDVVGEN